ncbi:MAG: S-layer homology domain-containing protein [Deltaproteobacteria bacterium]|nr:S-layer homology domain-containing protein [Deltaproteobacteria bacterium]
MKSEKIRTFILLFIICIAALFLISCGKKARVAVNQLDTPGHHTFTGLKLLEQEKYSDAKREFEMATQLDAKYSKAYTGMALVNIYTGKLGNAWDNLTLGLKNAQTDDEKLFVNVAKIRYHTLNKSDQKWLESAKNQFDEAVTVDSKHAPAYYFMGLAYKEALEFNQADKMFTKVLQLKTDHMADAEAQLKFLQKVHLAMPATEAGKKIALVERITRADAAALFMEELKIKELYKKPEPKISEAPLKEAVKEADKVADAPLKETEKVAAEAPAPAPAPVKVMAKDIADNPLKTDIEGILETGVRGLENDPKGNFNPGEVLSRGEFAIMLEDVLIKLTGEKDLAARYVNSKSLFPDVPADMPYFNAIISVTSRGIMEAKNIKTGEFAPLKPLSGVEALLIFRKLKEVLKIN